MRRLWLVVALLGGCIDEGSKPAADESEDAGADVRSTRDASGEVIDADEREPRDARVPRDVDTPPDVRPADAGPEPIEDACENFCDRLDECLAPACPQLGPRGIAGICDSACELPDAQLEAAASGTCEEFVERIVQAVPQLERVCGDAPPVDEECQALCDQARECGLGAPNCERFCDQIPPRIAGCFEAAADCEAFNACVQPQPPAPGECDAVCELVDSCGFASADECAEFCPEIPAPLRDCAVEAEDCLELGECFGDGPPDPAEQCQPWCQRQAQCVFRECAAGTLPEGFVGRCVDACVETPPVDFSPVFEGLCRDVVVDVRARDDDIDAACDADEEAVCGRLCADVIGPCSDQPMDACLADCAGFDDANLRCVQFADDCEGVLACFGDPEGQARCERFCDRISGCLLQSCPPRVIPPELGVNCTAGCLDNPPEDAVIEELEAATCREVREVVYRNNRQLAPICEGDRDFRPTGDECAAFCDNGLQACIGVGGRDFCLGACASLTREEYECALAAQGDCEAINACLE